MLFKNKKQKTLKGKMYRRNELIAFTVQVYL